MRKLVNLLMIIMIANQAFGDTFIVTSNAASGAGTLQNAMQQAIVNGTNTKDIIRFNLPYTTRAGRTIVLSEPLPALSSNLVIDGSTQPGDAFGRSGAKVEIDFTGSAHDSDLFRAGNSSSVEMYGLYLKGISGALYAVRLSAVSHFIFGAAGKGNLVAGFTYAVYSKENGTESRDFVIQGNLFGTTEEGTDAGVSLIDNAIDLTSVKDVLLGGNGTGEGNVVCGRLNPVNINYSTRGTPGYLKIYNNKMGTDVSGLVAIASASSGTINIFGVNENEYDNGVQTGTTPLRIEMINNIIANRINVFKIRDTFFIKRNHFGLGADDAANIGNNITNALFIQECGAGIIGGSEEDKNYFANSQTAILEAFTSNIIVTYNSFLCNTVAAIDLYGWSYTRQEPFIHVTSLSTSKIGGNALPRSTIHLYSNDDCGAICEGKQFLASFTADNKGNWEFTGINGKDIIATATDEYGATSEFSKATINDINASITNATCGKANGSISNIQIISGTSWHWENENGDIAGYDSSLRNAAPGRYRIVVDIGTATCSYKSNYYTVGNTELPADVTSATITNVDCGQASGTISVPPVAGLAASWFMNGTIFIDTGFTVTHLLPAKYYLKLSAVTDTSCHQTYGPYEVVNGSGGALDLSGVSITNASCGSSNGSISGIRSASINYWAWEDDKENVVARGSVTLSGMPAGRYRLKAKGNDNCDTITTPFYTIENRNAIIIDSSGMIITETSRCTASGSITGITARNGETFTWQDDNGKKAGTAADVVNLPVGGYVLTVSNQYGCKAVSFPVVIPPAPNADWQNLLIEIKPSDCLTNNGYIHVTGLANTSAYQYQWTDTSHTIIQASPSASLDPAKPGSYILLAKDNQGCEDTVLQTAVSTSTPTPVIEQAGSLIKDEICKNSNGSIENITIGGGTKPFYVTWKNESGDVVSTSVEASRLQAGMYRMSVTDAAGCTDSSTVFSINNTSVAYQLPVYHDILIPRHSTATLQLLNFQEGNYSLFDGASMQLPIQQNADGVFTTPVVDEDKTFYVMVSTGDCTSGVSIIQVKVADETKITVPAAFTPNSDGRNDKLKPLITGIFSLLDFIVYDRFGHIVFRTKKEGEGWDGTRNGKPLPAGTYIWMVWGKDGNRQPVYAKDAIVLIR